MELVDPPPRDPNLALGWSFGGVQQSQEGRFSGAGGSGEKDEFTGFDLEIERSENEPTLEILGNTAQSDHEPLRAPCD